ncbi:MULTISPECIES: YadA-like family protein [unclassified Pseudomonas]|uniref:YadA-like family protein n=1 Tax=unclassified Pseudomonas TaxID=196821 RepID=UPI0006D3DAE9|nr:MULTISPECIES: YadA-like family protein [unclassified Pseudomonas]
MNRIYRLVWSKTQHCWCVACEFARQSGKGGRALAVLGLGALGSIFLGDALAAGGSTYEKGIAGNAGIYVNDSTDSGCVFVHDTGVSGDQGWKYDGNNSNCKAGDKSSQTGRVLFYGTGTQSDGTNSLTLGNELYVNGGRIGLNNKIDGTNSLAIGNVGTDAAGAATGTQAVAVDSVAIGNNAVASKQNAMALGTAAQALAQDGVALGSGSVAGTSAGAPGYVPGSASREQADAIGATTSTLGAISVGDAATGKFRQITSLAAGTRDSDAVNVAQLKGVVGSATADAVMYDNSTHNSITLGGDTYDNSTHTGGTTITNVANGVNDSDAVNVSQLSELANTPITFVGNSGAVDKKLGDSFIIEGAATTAGSYSGANLKTEVDANGHLQLQMADNPQFDSVTTGNTTISNDGLTIIGGPSVTTVGIDAGNQKIINVAPGDISASSTDAVNGSQLNATNQQVDQNTTNISNVTSNISNLTTNIDNGTIGPVQRTGTDQLSLIAAGGDAYAPGAAQVLTNVAAGAVNATSTDAINGSQLHDTNQQVDANTTQITHLDGRVTNVEGDVTTLQGDVTNLGDNVKNIYNTGTKYFHANSTGTDSSATGLDSVAIGMGAVSSHDGSVALGSGSVADGITLGHQAYLVGGTANGEVNVGARRITGLSAGADDSDAVNVAQLKQVSGAATEGSVKYDLNGDGSINYNSVTMGGSTYNSVTRTGGTRITNVARGEGDSDAVNMSQLNETNAQVTNIDGRVTTVEGSITSINNGGGIKYFHANSSKADSVASGTDSIAVGPNAQASGKGAVAVGDGASASADGSVALGQGASDNGRGAESYTGKYSNAANASVGTVSVGNGATGETRTISNVADGKEATDAVNLRQLDGAVTESKQYTDDSIHNVNTQVANVTTNVSNLDNRVTHVEGDVSNVQNGTDGMFQVNNSSHLPKPKAVGSDSVAGGAGAEAVADNSTAIGSNAKAKGRNSVAIGANSVAERDNSVSVGSAGAERQVTNVAAGTAPTDAVNVGQLQRSMGDISDQFYDYTDSRYNALRHDLKKQDDILSSGIAGAMAMATLPQPYSPGASMATVGLGNFRGQGALAVGVSKISDNGKWVTKLQGSTTSQGETGVAVGLGYQW